MQELNQNLADNLGKFLMLLKDDVEKGLEYFLLQNELLLTERI